MIVGFTVVFILYFRIYILTLQCRVLQLAINVKNFLHKKLFQIGTIRKLGKIQQTKMRGTKAACDP